MRRMLKQSASSVLASFRPSTYPRRYASVLHSLRPCWTASLSILRGMCSCCATRADPSKLSRANIVFRSLRGRELLLSLIRQRSIQRIHLAEDVLLSRISRPPYGQARWSLTQESVRVILRCEAKETLADTRPQAQKNRKRIRWNTLRIFLSRARRRCLRIVCRRRMA